MAKEENYFTLGEFIFEVFGVKENDEERYSVVMVPWGEWYGLTVLVRSIEMYGASALAVQALY
ncbi:DUF6557 family protein [Desulfitispora alkaliphila]|uniref:DUF6557 family protein n=1 Tax=Desulfitispora alkaliphila TaxID=622674 RepID=UPI003D220117